MGSTQNGTRAGAIFLGGDAGWNKGNLDRVYVPAQRERLGKLVELHGEVVGEGALRRGEWGGVAGEARFVFSTWGMPALTEEEIGRLLPKVEAVFYAAGTVQGFARPFLRRGVKVCSAWAANGLPVAEFTLAHILLGMRRTWGHVRELKEKRGPAGWKAKGVTGSYGSTVALISLGMIGRRVVELLKPFDMKVIAYEPFARGGLAEELGIELVSLEECFRRGDVVSLHAPNLPSTRGMIRGEHFAAMKENATFINSARGAIVDAQGMFEVLGRRGDLTAVVDVCDPTEPPEEGSPFYTLPNVVLTPHIAGSMGNEVERMAAYMIDECERLLRGEALKYEVSERMLETMA